MLTTHRMHSIFKKGRITPYISLQVKRPSTTPNMDDLNNEVLMLYSAIPKDSQATQDFAYLQQGPDELLKLYLLCASRLLSKIHHMMDMSQILTEGLHHFTMVYGLDSHKVKKKVVGHQITYWRTIEDCISDICAVGAKYKRAKGYSCTDFYAQEVKINEVKSTKGPGPCFNVLNHISRVDA